MRRLHSFKMHRSHHLLCALIFVAKSYAFISLSVGDAPFRSDTCIRSSNTQPAAITISAETSNSTAATKHKHQRIPVLSYNNNYVIVSKPAGVSMHRNAKHWGHAAKSPSLEKLVRRQLSRKPYLVHRLDHRTSGAVIMGFDSQTAGRLHGRLRDDRAVKLYIALVRGDLRDAFANATGERLKDILPNTGTEAAPLIRRQSYSKVTVDLPIKVDGVEKDATTDFYFLSSIDLNQRYKHATREQEETHNNIEEPFCNKALSLLLCRPRTGRTHQIRRHLIKGFNSPIIGDSEHGDSRVNRFWRETIGLDRLGLHCWYLDLPPMQEIIDQSKQNVDGNDVRIQCMAALPDDLALVLQHSDLKGLWNEALELEPRLGMEAYDEKGGTYGRHYRSKLNKR